MTDKFIPSTQFIEKLPNICVDLELVSVYDMDCYSVPQLLYRLAQKINDTITNMEHNDEALKAHLEDLQAKLEYLLGEGLTTELQKIFEKMYADGTLQSLVEASMVDIKRRLDNLDSQMDKINKHITNWVNIKSYGAKGDNITDDTQAIKNAIGDMNNNLFSVLYFPQGEYKITESVELPNRSAWKFIGDSFGASKIKQHTDNIPVLILPSGSLMNSNSIEDLGIWHNTPQANNTKASGIYMNNTFYQCKFENLMFANSFYALEMNPNVVSFWGCTFDNIWFDSSLRGGAIKMSNLNKIPNNKFGRLFIDCRNMTQTVLAMKGYNSTIDTIEFLNANNTQLFSCFAGSSFNINCIKLELCNFSNTTTKILFNIENYSDIRINTFDVIATKFNNTNIFTSSGNDSAIINIGVVNMSSQENVFSNTILFKNKLKVNVQNLNILDSLTLATQLDNVYNNLKVNEFLQCDVSTLSEGLELSPNIDYYYIYENLTTDLTIYVPLSPNKVCTNKIYRFELTPTKMNGRSVIIKHTDGSTLWTITSSNPGLYELRWSRNFGFTTIKSGYRLNKISSLS